MMYPPQSRSECRWCFVFLLLPLLLSTGSTATAQQSGNECRLTCDDQDEPGRVATIHGALDVTEPLSVSEGTFLTTGGRDGIYCRKVVKLVNNSGNPVKLVTQNPEYINDGYPCSHTNANYTCCEGECDDHSVPPLGPTNITNVSTTMKSRCHISWNVPPVACYPEGLQAEVWASDGAESYFFITNTSDNQVIEYVSHPRNYTVRFMNHDGLYSSFSVDIAVCTPVPAECALDGDGFLSTSSGAYQIVFSGSCSPQPCAPPPAECGHPGNSWALSDQCNSDCTRSGYQFYQGTCYQDLFCDFAGASTCDGNFYTSSCTSQANKISRSCKCSVNPFS